MRNRLTYANVVATLALVFAMSGGAMAANHYLISEANQISPKILKKLKGKTGATGKTGAPGTSGAPGAPGAAGTPGAGGKEGAPGPAGSAVAYAHILGLSSPASPLDTANSKNVSAATEPFTGGYCVSTTVPIKNVAGVPDFASGGMPGTTVNADFTELATAVPGVCPVGTTVLLETGTGGTAAKADFWVSFN
jgi:hypothetical protein